MIASGGVMPRDESGLIVHNIFRDSFKPIVFYSGIVHFIIFQRSSFGAIEHEEVEQYLKKLV